MRTPTPVLLFLVSLLIITLSACGDDGGEDNTNSDAITGNDVGDDGGDANTSTMCGAPTGERPPRLSEHAGVYDFIGQKVILHGGSLGIPENCGFPTSTFESTTWIYDVACDSWRRLDDSNAPERARHAAAYDSTNHRMITFGGRWRPGTSGSYSVFNDTWAFDIETETWSELATTGNAPPGLANTTLVYDPTEHRAFVFSGSTETGLAINPVNGVWSLDLATLEWTNVTPVMGAAPEPRLWATAIWDPKRRQLVAFGGGDDSAFTGNVSYFDDLWAFNGRSWTQLDAGSNSRIDGRFWAGLVYDPINDRYVMFGGHDAGNVDGQTLGNRNDTAYFDPNTEQWSTHLIGDTYNVPPRGFCDFPPDFTNVDMGSPERRNAHVFVSGTEAAFIMGGKTDCGVIDDLGRFNFADGTWTRLTHATLGEACLRSGGGDSCSDLCL